jgi:hypothetical protein
MKQEANRFIFDALGSDSPVPDMLTATHTFIDESLGALWDPRGAPSGSPGR